MRHTFHLEVKPETFQKVLFGTLHNDIKSLIVSKCSGYDCIMPKYNDFMLIDANGFYVFIYLRANTAHTLYHRLDIDMNSIKLL